MTALDPADVLIELWRDAGLDDEALDDVGFTGSEPALPSSFAIGTAAQATIGAAALAAAELWRLRTGRRQRVNIEMRSAAIEFRSERYLRVDGKDPDDHHDQIAGLYRCGDGRWARLHTNLPHHRTDCFGFSAVITTKPRCSARLSAGRRRSWRPSPPRPASWLQRAGLSTNGMLMRKAARSPACHCSVSRKSARRRS